jgi:hypothetical protein
VGLEVGRILANLGIIADVSVGQRAPRVKAHGRLWDAAHTRLTASSAAAGFPSMYLTLHLRWEQHTPLWAATPLAAAPHSPGPRAGMGAAAAAAAAADRRAVLASFSPPQGINGPASERVRLLSKPSVQRWVGLPQLLAARRASRPGVYLLSTTQGLLTDIDCELRGIGGTLLAHLALPLGHVTTLRGLLRAKHDAELAAAAAAGGSRSRSSSGTPGSTGQQQQQQQQQQRRRRQLRHGPVHHVPLAEWDARGQVVSGLLRRLADSQDDALAFVEAHQAPGGAAPPLLFEELLQAGREELLQLEVQEAAWRKARGGGGGGGGGAAAAPGLAQQQAQHQQRGRGRQQVPAMAAEHPEAAAGDAAVDPDADGDGEQGAVDEQGQQLGAGRGGRGRAPAASGGRAGGRGRPGRRGGS